MSKLFVLCTKTILHHGQVAFQKGHVYVAEKKDSHDKNYAMVSDLESHESFPKKHFEANFIVIMPNMWSAS